ncbi:MAG: radical SAM protein [Chloroflexi bacterium]|nr:radical SAM protein [Chloroflexota bacterium]
MTTGNCYATTVQYGAFSRQMWKAAKVDRLPLCGTMEVNESCNLKCAHCYMRDLSGHGRPVLTYQEITRILDEIAEAGGLWLLLTGGEPFLRPDFLDIYTYAKEKGFIVTLFTNGTLITRKIARYLGEMKPFSMEITMYGASPETYRRVTGSGETFHKMRRAVEFIREEGIPLKLKTVVMTLNAHEIWEMKDFARSLGLQFGWDPMINPALDVDGHRDVLPFRLTPEKVMELEMADLERCAEWQRTVPKLFPAKGVMSNDLFTCGAGKQKYHIDPYGRLQLCVLARFPNYDLRQGSFKEGYYGPLEALSYSKLTSSSRCRTCEYRGLCNICPGWSHLENGSLEETPVPYLCRMSRLRAQAFGGGGEEDDNNSATSRKVNVMAPVLHGRTDSTKGGEGLCEETTRHPA